MLAAPPQSNNACSQGRFARQSGKTHNRQSPKTCKSPPLQVFYHTFFEKAMIKSVFLDSSSAIIRSQGTKKSEMIPQKVPHRSFKSQKKIGKTRYRKKKGGLNRIQSTACHRDARHPKHLAQNVPYHSISRRPKLTPHLTKISGRLRNKNSEDTNGKDRKHSSLSHEHRRRSRSVLERRLHNGQDPKHCHPLSPPVRSHRPDGYFLKKRPAPRCRSYSYRDERACLFCKKIYEFPNSPTAAG